MTVPTCPACGTVLETASSGRNSHAETVSLDIPLALLPMLAHALIIERNRAMMSQNRACQAGAAEMLEKIQDLVPEQARNFTAEAWAATLAQVLSGEGFEIGIARDETRVWDKARWIEIRSAPTGDLLGKSERFETPEDAREAASSLADLLNQLSPLS